MQFNIYGGENESREIWFKTGLYPGVCRMCHWNWKRMEVSLHMRSLWRCSIYFNLSGIFADYGYSGTGV